MNTNLLILISNYTIQQKQSKAKLSLAKLSRYSLRAKGERNVAAIHS
jgi:hypothetical protein